MPEFIVHFETLGCRLNQIESESAARFFADAGFVVDMESMTAAAPVPENVVLSIINTCTVTGKAEQKARRLIRLLLRKMPHSCVLVTGCYAELEVEAIQAIDQRVCVLPGSRKDLLADIPLELKAHLDSVSGVTQIEITPFLKKLVDRLCAEKPKPTNIKNRHSEDDVHGHGPGEQGEWSKNEKKSLLVSAKPLKNKDLYQNGEYGNITKGDALCIEYGTIILKDAYSKISKANDNLSPEEVLPLAIAAYNHGYPDIIRCTKNTSNLSEDWIGYSTRYGDSAGDFGPIAGITVEEVLQVGEYLGLPDNLVHKVPSDGLSGMSDEDKIGFTYAVLDKYIRTGVCEDADTKAKIDRMNKMNAFKLKPLPFYKPDKELL